MTVTRACIESLKNCLMIGMYPKYMLLIVDTVVIFNCFIVKRQSEFYLEMCNPSLIGKLLQIDQHLCFYRLFPKKYNSNRNSY